MLKNPKLVDTSQVDRTIPVRAGHADSEDKERF